MGASQSNPINESTTNTTEEMEVSLYTILGVEKNANDIELKKAYKKQALLLHPDRNFDRVEEATTKFAKIQAAYDILSDPQERAWYDSHGEGRPGGPDEPEYGGKITKQTELEAYLDPGLYQNVSTNPDEFFDLIGRLFQQLSEEEHEAALDAAGGNDDIDLPHLPPFGNSKSMWSTEVKPFYDSWSSFSSIKSFVWENIYRSWDAPDRRSRRAMEVRNKKIQDAARNEFNATVRNLIKLIRQKDPRVRAHNKKKSKAEDSSSKEQAKRDRQKHTAKKQEEQYEEQEWEKVGEDDILDNINDDEDEVVDVYECVVCDKLFKTKKQLSVHEASKRHVKNLRDLQREMRREGVELGFDEEEEDEEDEEGEGGEGEGEEESLSTTPVLEKEVKADNVNNEDNDNDNDEDNDDSDPTSTTTTTPITSKADPTLEDLLAQLEDSRISSRSPTPKPSSKSSKGKAKQRRQKKDQAQNEFANKCSVCQTAFSSRNKLFDHVKISGHAAPRKL